MIAVLVVATFPAAAATWDQYRVVLKDGSWLIASEKPQLGENQAEAYVRLPSGLMTIEETRMIDWQRTRAWNFNAVYLRDVIAGNEGVVDLSGDDAYGEAIPGVESARAVDDTRLALLADPPQPLDPVTEMRNRALDLGDQIGVLKERKSVLEKAAAVTRTPRKAMELRLQVESLDEEIRVLRSEQARVILNLPNNR